MTFHEHGWLAIALLGGLGACVPSGGGAARAATPQKTDNSRSAMLVDSGSTNTDGFQIVVERSGQTQYTAIPRGRGGQAAERPSAVGGKLPAALAQRLYADLEAARPLASLPEAHCLKSASFGTTLIIEYGGERTPDLSCPAGTNARVQALVRDAKEIVEARNQPRTAGR